MRSKIESSCRELLEGSAFDISIPDRNGFNMETDDGFLQHGLRDERVVKYEVNEKGIGRILLPPSLSILLQSDRVSILPHAGGLFIQSVYKSLE
jgi:hypothetical protein